jgi:hypothetical protein
MILNNKKLNLNLTIPHQVINYGVACFEPTTTLNAIMHPKQMKPRPGFTNKVVNLNFKIKLDTSKVSYIFLQPDYLLTKQYADRIIDNTASYFSIGTYFSTNIAKDILIPSLDENDIISYKLLASNFKILSTNKVNVEGVKPCDNDKFKVESQVLHLNYKPKLLLLTDNKDYRDDTDIRNLDLVNEFKIKCKDKNLRLVKDRARFLSDRDSYDVVGFLNKQPPVIDKGVNNNEYDNLLLLNKYKSNFGSANQSVINRVTENIDNDDEDVTLDNTTIQKYVLDLIDKSERTIVGNDIKMLVLKVTKTDDETEIELEVNLKFELIKMLSISQQQMVQDADLDVYYNWSNLMNSLYHISSIFYNYNIVDIMTFIFLPNGLAVPEITQDELRMIENLLGDLNNYYRLVVVFLKILDKLNIKLNM